jgi:methylenetetrahydrofolate reductase (NADPH)
MPTIAELIAAGPTWSIEFFPPRSEDAERQLREALDDLVPLGPSFASVTYGALGSTRERTRDLVVDLNARHPFPTMAHLTCVGHTHAEIDELLDEYARRGVRDILALGGDPPADGGEAGGDFAYALELVEMVRDHPAGFCVGVAAHPEIHPRSADRLSDREHLAAKLAIADFAITQFFFHTEDYLRLVEELAGLGCERPVIPGVMPFVSVAGLARMAGINGTRIPPTLAERLAPLAADAEAVTEVGIEVSTALSAELMDAGAPGIHLYTLNRSGSVRRIWQNLGLAGRRGGAGGFGGGGEVETEGP